MTAAAAAEDAAEDAATDTVTGAPAATADPSVRACATPEDLAGLEPHPELDMFRPPARQMAALRDLAADERCCVAAASADGALVGYAAFHPPSEIETWGEDRTGRLRELGAIEVAPSWRGHRLAERLLRAAFDTGRFEDTVVFATLYVWHYDLKRTDLGDFAYRRLLDRLYRKVGLEPVATSDPEIRSSAANALMARVGPSTPPEVREEFGRLRARPLRLPTA